MFLNNDHKKVSGLWLSTILLFRPKFVSESCVWSLGVQFTRICYICIISTDSCDKRVPEREHRAVCILRADENDVRFAESRGQAVPRLQKDLE